MTTNNIFTASYASAKGAKAAAKKAGVDPVVETRDGRWFVIEQSTENVPAPAPSPELDDVLTSAAANAKASKGKASKVITVTQTILPKAKAPKAEKAPAPAKAPKGPSKKARVAEMITGKPTAVADIAKALEISDIAARSLIGDLRRDGASITSHGKGVFSI